MPLETEIQYYEDHLSELLKDEGKFVVIHDQKIVGIYEDEHDAYVAGLRNCGLNSAFLLRKILKEQPVYYNYTVLELKLKS